MRVKIWAIGVSSALLAAYGAALFYEGYMDKAYSSAMTFPFIDRPAAERAYDSLPPNTPLARRGAAAARLLKADPSSARSWAMASYVDWLRHGGRLTPQGMSDFDRSYTMSPLDHDAGPWRINFALENWDRLSPEQRKTVIDEANWLFVRDPTAAADLKARLRTIRNPLGRTMARLELVLAP